MIQIRNMVFQTNSSSTHSIAISKESVSAKDFPQHIDFNIGEFGWECRQANPNDYIYTAVMQSSDPQKYLDKIAETLDKFGISYTFGDVEYDEYGVSNGYIDHGLDEEIVEDIVMNEDRLMRYLCGRTCVYTGNDNCDCDQDINRCLLACFRARQDSDHEYYFKGN